MMNTCDNPNLRNYFDKNFAEYKKGFESKGKNYSSHLPSHRSLIFWGLCEYLVNTFNYVLGILKSSKSSKPSNMRFSHAYTSKQILEHRIDFRRGLAWPRSSSQAHLCGQLQPSHPHEGLWPEDLCGCLWPVWGKNNSIKPWFDGKIFFILKIILYIIT